MTTELPFSSTNPISCNGRLQLPLTQTKCSGHQIRPSAVINGPLYILKGKNKISFIFKQCKCF